MKVGWKTVMKQQKLVEKMTIEEKAAILSGKTVWQTREIDRLSIPSIFLSDGPHGIRKQAGAGDHLGLNASLKATCFPTAATIANSWNQDLGEEIGQALGEEAASMDVNILLGPGLNIKRSPLCGRNFEYFSEDPYLSGKMAASYIRGIQSKGVYACPKHLAVNSQELRRMAMDAVVDERTLREIYLTGFEIAVKEGHAKAIMSSYNQINGIYANEDKHLLTDILRKEWGFDGIVVTDWGGSNDHVKGVAAGSNLEMPSCGYDSAREVIAAVRNGKLKEADLDERVGELVDAVMELTSGKKLSDKNFDRNAHHQLARKAAAESMILLKNEKQDEQMARFRFMLDYSDEAVCMNDSPLARGEKVRVIKGPLSGLVGELVTVGSKSKIAVRLNMLGCACVDMPIGYVEPIHLINDTPKV